MFALTILIVAVFGVIVTLAYMSRFHRPMTIGYVVRIALIAGILCYMGLVITVPAERIHFVEYALLGLAIERVLRHYIPDRSRTLISVLSVYFIGMADETIQCLLSNRHGEIMDVVLNGWGGALGILLLPWPQQSWTSTSHWLMFLMMTVAITLSIVFTFATRDFGYMIVDEAKGLRFRSRLSRDDLLDYDLKNGNRLASILKRDMGLPYDQFLIEYPADKHPFLHEMRVHLFRRDRYTGKRGVQASWTALQENRILESYFGRTLVEAELAWSEDELERIESRSTRWEGRSLYTSLVSKKVISAFCPFELAMIGVGFLGLNSILFFVTTRWLHAG